MLVSELLQLLGKKIVRDSPVVFEYRDVHGRSDTSYSIDAVEYQNGFLVLVSQETP